MKAVRAPSGDNIRDVKRVPALDPTAPYTSRRSARSASDAGGTDQADRGGPPGPAHADGSRIAGGRRHPLPPRALRRAAARLARHHRFDKNRIAELRSSYLRDAIEEFRREAGLADKAGRTDDRLEWQAKVEEAQALDKRLPGVQEGHHEGPDGGDRDYRISTPWKEPAERPKGWDPDIQTLEKAGVLRIGKVT